MGSMYKLGTIVTFGGVTRRTDVQYGVTRFDKDVPWSLWTMDVPTVLGLLGDVAAGRGTAAEALAALEAGLTALIARSGCCPQCEGSVDRYEAALAEYAAAVDVELARAVGMTGETHPYNVTISGAIHAFNCRHAGDVGIPHPGNTLQLYVHGDTEADWPDSGCGESRVRGGQYAQRMTPDELIAWIRSRRGPKGGDGFRRCRVCQPALPVAYRSEACDVE